MATQNLDGQTEEASSIRVFQASEMDDRWLREGWRIAAIYEEMVLMFETDNLPAELRSTKFIHPTLRRVVREFGKRVEDVARTYDMAFYPDRSEDDWDVRRGGQTITEKTP